MLEQIEAGEDIRDLKMNVLQAIQYIIQSWDEVTIKTIQNCWRHTEILSFNNNIIIDETNDIDEADDLIFDEQLNNAIKTLHFSNAMKVKEFLTIPEEDNVYEILEDDQIITELVNTFKSNRDGIDNLDDMDDSTEVPTVSINVALKSLKNIHTFLFQQEDANEYIKSIDKIGKFIKKKKKNMMQQATLDQYFNN
jgi:hypothetical protein